MPKTVKIDITGQRFGRLVALRFVPDDSKYASFVFVCDCGAEKKILGQSVRFGNTFSCGCGHRDAMEKRIKHGHARGHSKRSPTYSSWASMMDRCEWGGHKIMFAKYGAREIRVCERWHSFENFLADMGERLENTSIDRINNSKGYFKENCRWATRHEQALNTSRTVRVVINDEVVAVYDLCSQYSLPRKALRARASRRGNNYVEALKTFGIECSHL